MADETRKTDADARCPTLIAMIAAACRRATLAEPDDYMPEPQQDGAGQDY